MQLYTVKKAAAIIGCSTNTLYKYLDEGRIKASRGTADQGRFRIPQSSLEEFLGTPLPASVSTPALPAGLPLKIVRALIVVGLLLIIFDNQFTRILFIAIALLLAYQQGGYLRSNS